LKKGTGKIQRKGAGKGDAEHNAAGGATTLGRRGEAKSRSDQGEGPGEHGTDCGRKTGTVRFSVVRVDWDSRKNQRRGTKRGGKREGGNTEQKKGMGTKFFQGRQGRGTTELECPKKKRKRKE